MKNSIKKIKKLEKQSQKSKKKIKKKSKKIKTKTKFIGQRCLFPIVCLCGELVSSAPPYIIVIIVN